MDRYVHTSFGYFKNGNLTFLHRTGDKDYIPEGFINSDLFKLIDNLSIGEIQYHEGITVFPLMTNLESIPYISLKEAHANQLIQISEVSESGSIPELRVVNFSQKNILLIDGEELAGAKQNRILNTSIMAPAKGDIVIPVTCTEEGRWSYDTPNFYDTDELASTVIRARKMG